MWSRCRLHNTTSQSAQYIRYRCNMIADVLLVSVSALCDGTCRVMKTTFDSVQLSVYRILVACLFCAVIPSRPFVSFRIKSRRTEKPKFKSSQNLVIRHFRIIIIIIFSVNLFVDFENRWTCFSYYAYKTLNQKMHYIQWHTGGNQNVKWIVWCLVREWNLIRSLWTVNIYAINHWSKVLRFTV